MIGFFKARFLAKGVQYFFSHSIFFVLYIPHMLIKLPREHFLLVYTHSVILVI